MILKSSCRKLKLPPYLIAIGVIICTVIRQDESDTVRETKVIGIGNQRYSCNSNPFTAFLFRRRSLRRSRLLLCFILLIAFFFSLTLRFFRLFFSLTLAIFASLSERVFAQQKPDPKKIEQEKQKAKKDAKDAKEAKRKAEKEAKEAKRKAKKEAKEAKRKAKEEGNQKDKTQKQSASPQTPPAKKKSSEGIGITGIPLISYSDDLGFTYGVRLILTDYRANYNPYRYQVWGQFQLSTAGFQDHAARSDSRSRMLIPVRTLPLGIALILLMSW